MGVGYGQGDHKTVEAAQKAVSSPLLDDVSIAGATSVLINITANSELTLFEAYEASNMIQEEAHEDANVIWGWVVDETLKDEVRVTVIATGFDESWLKATPDIESRVRRVVHGNARGGAAPPSRSSSPSLASGLNPDDYDIPTFFRSVD